MSIEEPRPASTEPAPQTFTAPAPAAPNLFLGLLVGAGAAIVGALVWAGIAYATNMVIGYIAIGIGFLVGLGMRRFGRGSTPVFGVAGGALAFAGCVLGDLLAGVAMASKSMNVSIGTMVQNLPSDVVISMLKEQDPMGWIIYGIAVFAGYKYSIAPAAASIEPPHAG